MLQVCCCASGSILKRSFGSDKNGDVAPTNAVMSFLGIMWQLVIPGNNVAALKKG